MQRFIPIPGDLIIVERSEWYALPDGGKLRVCEAYPWSEPGEQMVVAPRSQVSTFWGPGYGPPKKHHSMHMSTSGGPFKTVKLLGLKGLELIGEEEDLFWCWKDLPCANGGMEYTVTVALWKLSLLPDDHYRELVQLGLPTHRDGKPVRPSWEMFAVDSDRPQNLSEPLAFDASDSSEGSSDGPPWEDSIHG